MRLRIRVPATSANLGPGFDALGIALAMYNDFRFADGDDLAGADLRMAGADLRIRGCPDEFTGPDNLFAEAYRAALDELGLPWRGLSLGIGTRVPLARGLGSSATLLVAGVAAAAARRAELSGEDPAAVDRSFILDLAARMEGHPDNVAPAIHGGFCAAIMAEPAGGGLARTTVCRAALGEDIVFHALIPPFELPTKEARAALPATVSLRDAAFNAGRAAMTACAFATGNYELLADACEDRLHQPWRAPLIPGYGEISGACRGAGALGVWLSGAGPTILAPTRRGDESLRFGQAIDPLLRRQGAGAWERLVLDPDNEGVRIEAIGVFRSA